MPAIRKYLLLLPLTLFSVVVPNGGWGCDCRYLEPSGFIGVLPGDDTIHRFPANGKGVAYLEPLTSRESIPTSAWRYSQSSCSTAPFGRSTLPFGKELVFVHCDPKIAAGSERPPLPTVRGFVGFL